MADIALGSVEKIVKVALKIKDAVETVKHNEKECRDIERCVARVTALLKRLDETMEEEVMRASLEDLAGSLQRALELITNCQRKHAFRRFIGAGGMAKELRQVQEDILRKVTIGTFATVIQLSVTLTNGQDASPSQQQKEDIGKEKPSHGGHPTGGDRFDFSVPNMFVLLSFAIVILLYYVMASILEAIRLELYTRGILETFRHENKLFISV